MTDQKTLNILAKGAALVAGGMMFSKIATYAYRAIVARLIGPEAYGQLSLGLTVLGLGVTISLVALNEGLKTYIPNTESKEEARNYILSAFQIGIPLSLVMAAGVYLSSNIIAFRVFSSAGLESVIQVFAFVIPFAVLSRISISATVAFQHVKYRVITNQIFQNIVQLISTIILVYIGFGVLGAVYGWLAGVVLSSFLGFYYMEEKVGPFLRVGGKFESKKTELLRFSGPLLLTGVIGTVLGWTDTLFLGYYLPESEVGFYNAALPTAMLILAPFQALSSLSLPSLSALREQGREELSSTLKTLARWSVTFTFPGFILMALFSSHILKLLFGSEYTISATAMTILAFGYMFQTATGHIGDILKTYERTDLLTKNTVAKLVLNIPLNIYLIPKFGIEGAAIATTLSIIFINLLTLVEASYLFNIHPFSFNIIRPLAATIPSLAATYFMLHLVFEHIPIWAMVPGFGLFGLLYAISLVGFGGLKEEDKPIIVGLGRRIKMEKEAKKLAEIVIR